MSRTQVRKRTAKPSALSTATRDSLQRMLVEKLRAGIVFSEEVYRLPYACCDGNHCPFHKRLPQRRESGITVHTAIFNSTTLELLHVEHVVERA